MYTSNSLLELHPTAAVMSTPDKCKHTKGTVRIEQNCIGFAKRHWNEKMHTITLNWFSHEYIVGICMDIIIINNGFYLYILYLLYIFILWIYWLSSVVIATHERNSQANLGCIK